MRQVCNIAYVAQVEHMDEKEFKRFQKELLSDPTKGPVSHGTSALQGLFWPPPGRKPPEKKSDRPKVNPDRKGPTHRAR